MYPRSLNFSAHALQKSMRGGDAPFDQSRAEFDPIRTPLFRSDRALQSVDTNLYSALHVV